MKIACQILFLFCFCTSIAAQQYYVRGIVKDESGKILQNVQIIQHKTGYVFKSGSEGTFGIATNYKIDTFSFILEGFQKETIAINAEEYIQAKLKKVPASVANARRDKLASLTKNLEKDIQKTWFSGDETYASILENHFVDAKK